MTDEFEFSEGPGLTFSRAQVEAWVGHPLTDDQVADIEEALPLSTLPETVDTVAHEALGIRAGMEDDEPFPQGPEDARVCIHGNRVWFGNECGLCDAAGKYIWRES